MASHSFSDRLERWLKDKTKPKTLKSLVEVFGEKSFATLFLVLMFIPALPLPTGGITHVFELITMLLALELVWGRRTIWLPKRWQKRKLGELTQGKAIPFIIRTVRWFERFSRRRLAGLMEERYFIRGSGAAIFILALAAFVAPPFSGLDTLTSLGAVLLSLSLILEDIVVLVLGVVIGSLGIGLEFWLGKAAFQGIHNLFK